MIFIFIILSLFGLNIINYMNKTSKKIIDTTSQTANTINQTSGNVLNETVNNVKIGSKVGLNVAGGVLKDLEKELDVGIIERNPHKSPSGYQPDTPILPRKSGYCYIGTEKGYRSCIYSGRNDVCMSGDIYPTIDVCINPKLRV